MSESPGGYQVPNYDSLDDGSAAYTFHSKIMVAAIVVLCLVLLLILFLHVYVKWFWENGRALPFLGRHRPDLVGQEAFQRDGSAGLGKDVIDSLPTFTYKLSQSEEEVVECVVCLCAFQEGENVRLLPTCRHMFHIECIDMWLYSHSSCPLCRTGVGMDPPSAIGIIRQDRSAESSVSVIVPQNLDLSDLAGIPQLGNTREGSECPRQGTHGAEIIPLSPLASVSERLQQDLCVEYPTNVLFWGDHTQVNTHVTSSARSLPHILVDVPSRSFDSPRCLSFNNPRRGNLSSPRCLYTEEQPCTPSPHPLKSPLTRHANLKRLLTRQYSKCFATQHDGEYTDQDGAVSQA